MNFTGRYTIPAPPEAVWDGLNDPKVLKACIPGCEQIEKINPTEFVATATLKVGPVKATFKGKVMLSELDPPSRCVLRGEGQGGVAGFAKGEAEVILARDTAGTLLTYTAKAAVGGKLAQVGQRLIDGAAKQIADDFFARFVAVLSPGSKAPQFLPDPYSEPTAMPEAIVANAAAGHEGLGPEIWVAGLIGVIVVLLVLFGVVFR